LGNDGLVSSDQGPESLARCALSDKQVKRSGEDVRDCLRVGIGEDIGGKAGMAAQLAAGHDAAGGR
jgi:hypothetical protein